MKTIKNEIETLKIGVCDICGESKEVEYDGSEFICSNDWVLYNNAPIKEQKTYKGKDLIPALFKEDLEICKLCKHFYDYSRFYCCEFGRKPLDISCRK